jgi:hypothetical protein
MKFPFISTPGEDDHGRDTQRFQPCVKLAGLTPASLSRTTRTLSSESFSLFVLKFFGSAIRPTILVLV